MAWAQHACVIAIATVLATGCAEHLQLLVPEPGGGRQPYTFWPPPGSTSVWMAAANSPTRHDATLGAVADRVTTALKEAGYADQRWYPIGARYAHGFAVTTRLERIAPDGGPQLGATRWLPSVQHASDLRWLAGARELRLKAPPGRYRALLVAFTDLPLTHEPHHAWEWNEQTVMSGPDLPNWVLPTTRQPSAAYRLGVYIYEYAADSADDQVRFLPVDAKIDASAHVNRAGLSGLADATSTRAAVSN